MKSDLRIPVRSLVVLAAGFLLGWMTATHDTVPEVMADTRQAPPPKAFKSGGERSAEILEKISKQIQTMDTRLARIEAVITDKNRKKSD